MKELLENEGQQRLLLKGQQPIKLSIIKVNQRTKRTEEMTPCSRLKNFCSFNKDLMQCRLFDNFITFLYIVLYVLGREGTGKDDIYYLFEVEIKSCYIF